MGALTIDLFSSLDGFAASDGWPGYWGKEGPELMAWLDEKLAEDHTLVMGANTYREMSQIVAEGDDPTFERMAEIPKVAFSSTLKPPLTWANTGSGGRGHDAAWTKSQISTPLRTMGSISLNATLLRERLIDLLQIVVFPVVLGARERSRSSRAGPISTSSWLRRTLDGRMQLLQYVPTLH